jgi:hypothetical protein
MMNFCLVILGLRPRRQPCSNPALKQDLGKARFLQQKIFRLWNKRSAASIMPQKRKAEGVIFFVKPAASKRSDSDPPFVQTLLLLRTV